MEPESDGATLVNESSQRLLALSGMTSVVYLSSLWAATMLPLSRGYLMIALSLVRSTLVIYDCGLEIQHESRVSTDICHA